MTSRYLAFLSILVFSGTLSYSQPDSSLNLKQAVIIKRLVLPVNFDGIPDEEAWDAIIPLKLIMHSPVFGKEPTENTDSRIAYDDKYLYVSGRLYYEDASMMRSVSFKRDYMGMGCDWYGVILDTYNDKENALAFFTTPDALRWDASIQKDAVVQQPDQIPINMSWNTFWDVRTKQDKEGWSAEIRIPFSSLRFQEQNGEVRMGLIIQRWIPVKNETDNFPGIAPIYGENSAIKPSQAQEVILHDVKPGKPIYIAPYLLAGYESIYELNGQETVYLESGKPAFEAGLDVKYGITNNMIMDMTVNTDFAQVEADDQQINLTRFSLYFPEKRMFFLERASIFDFAMGGTNNLFYSRRIGLSDDGDPVRIYGGARMTGRLGKWDLGLLDMQTAPLWGKDSLGAREEILPSENFGALRLRRQVFNENSYVGAMMTSRLGVNGSYNMAYGLDGIIRLFGNDYLDLKWSQSFENDIKNISLKEPSRFNAIWERRSSKGLGYDLGYEQSGIHYNPGIGFEMIDDYAVIRGSIRYDWLSGENSALYRHSPEIRCMYMTYVDDGSLMTFTNYTGWTFQTKNQWQGSLNLVYNVENLRDSLEINEDEVFISPAKYEYLNFMGFITTSMSKPFFTMVRTEAGQYFNGTRISVRIQPTWNISRHVEIGGTYNFDRVRFKERDQEMTNHIVGIKALYMLDTRLSINAFLQYNTAVHGIITNFRLRYNPKEGNDFYLVINEDRNTDLNREVPNLPVYNSRAIMLKYTYTFNL